MGEPSGACDSEETAEITGHVGGASGSRSGTSSQTLSQQDLFLHFEVLSPGQHKAAQATWFTLGLVIIGTFCAAQYLRVQEKYFNRSWQTLFIRQLPIAGLCLIVILPMFGWFSARLLATRNCFWSRRQRYLVAIAFLQICLQVINLVFWVTPNVYIALQNCKYRSGLVNACTYLRWTCWNSIYIMQIIHAGNCFPYKRQKHNSVGRSRNMDSRLKVDCKDPMVLDTSFLRSHWLEVAAWCFMEISILYMAGTGGVTWEPGKGPNPSLCSSKTIKDKARPTAKYGVVVTIWNILLVIYLLAAGIVARSASAALKDRPYNRYQFANTMMLWQRRISIWSEALGVAELIIDMLDVLNMYQVPIGGGTITFIQQWNGQSTLQIITTAGTVMNAFYFLPTRPTNEEHFQVWLQDFAWTKEDLNRRQKAMLRHSPGMEHRLLAKPMFCMETALKLLLWSDVAYEVDCSGEEGLGEAVEERAPRYSEGGADAQALSNRQVPIVEEGGSCRVTMDIEAGRPDVSPVKVVQALSSKEALDLAMQAYNLQNVKVIHAAATDTKAVLAWGEGCLVLAFRGTQSLTNACTDAQAWRVPHPPKRGVYILGRQPLVHKGFLRAWQDVAEPVLSAVKDVLEKSGTQKRGFQVFVTGHSLGGALAILAACSIQGIHALPGICCYTFGAPRPSNGAFATEYKRMCPNTYNIINDRDAVPKTGKLMGAYKRPGERVLINQGGDIRVRPSIFEVHLQHRGYSVRQHLLVSYLESLGSVLIAQLFQSKALEGGLAGVRQLALSQEICKLLTTVGIDLPAQLQRPYLSVSHTIQKVKGLKKFRHNLVAMMRELQETPFVWNAE